MKCPYCNKEMKEGFIRALGRGGVCWVNEKDDWSAPRSDAGFLQLGNAPWLKLIVFRLLIVIHVSILLLIIQILSKTVTRLTYRDNAKNSNCRER